MTGEESFELDVFLCGELTDLCIPTPEFAASSSWYKWLNDKSLVRYLEQGVFPNTKIKQLKYFESLPNDRIALIIVDKQKVPIGVVSLSFINHEKKSCNIALVVSNDGDKRLKPLVSLEAMALMTSHAFDLLGMKRINAGQHIKLAGWQSRLELIGYQVEGLHVGNFVKGSETSDGMSIAVCKKNYDLITSKRGGVLWDNYIEMKRRVKSMPRHTCLDMLIKFYDTEREDYYSEIFRL